jgi:hypothetical protein
LLIEPSGYKKEIWSDFAVVRQVAKKMQLAIVDRYGVGAFTQPSQVRTRSRSCPHIS